MDRGSEAFSRIATAIRYIEEHFAQRPSLADMARAAGLSPAHFSREFSRWAGLSPTRYLRLLALQAAKRSLAADASVLAAAWEAGLSGPGRLHDLFVSFEAVTPGEFKSRGSGMTIVHGHALTPFGRAHFGATPRGLAWLSFADDGAGEADVALRAGWPAATLERDDGVASRLARQVFAERSGPLALHLHGSNFQVQVWRALLELGSREALTYSGLAAAIGRPGAARAVGQAVGRNPVAWIIPCHHVLRRDGGLGGYHWGVDRKRAMLAWELARAAG